jgi:hypothetical protein
VRFDALVRYWMKKPDRTPRIAQADWSRRLAKRLKIISQFRRSNRLRVLEGKRFGTRPLWRKSWSDKRVYLLARQEFRCQPRLLSKQQGMSGIRPVNRPKRSAQ